MEQQVKSKVDLKRRALEADFERRVRWQSEECESKARQAMDALADVKRQSKEQGGSFHKATAGEAAAKEELVKKEQLIAEQRDALSEAREQISHERQLRTAAEHRASYRQGMGLEHASLDELEALGKSVREALARRDDEMLRRVRSARSDQ
jgi:hypothetical protein